MGIRFDQFPSAGTAPESIDAEQESTKIQQLRRLLDGMSRGELEEVGRLLEEATAHQQEREQERLNAPRELIVGDTTISIIAGDDRGSADLRLTGGGVEQRHSFTMVTADLLDEFMDAIRSRSAKGEDAPAIRAAVASALEGAPRFAGRIPLSMSLVEKVRG
ncbi:hypothetical protein HZA86_02775 [Candidatus Uhrbacteria bacterium]|nr:hypothetical protein [Candidatus Uhrbacteria bacterium]